MEIKYSIAKKLNVHFRLIDSRVIVFVFMYIDAFYIGLYTYLKLLWKVKAKVKM